MGRQRAGVERGQLGIGDEDLLVLGRASCGDRKRVISQFDIGQNILKIERILALILQLHTGEEQHPVEVLLGHCSAAGVEAGALDVLRMSPHMNNLSCGHGRLYPGQHVDGDGDGDHHGRDDAGPDHMAASLGEGFAAGSIVDFFPGFLLE